MPNKKHEPWYVRTPQSAMEGLIDKSWYVRTPQSAMDGLIDKSMNATEISDKFE